jgi:hypothetical protein
MPAIFADSGTCLPHITPAIKHHNPDVGALLAAPRLGGASAAPTIDMFNCARNTNNKEDGSRS